MNDKKDNFWNPYVAGFVLGLVLLASFVVTGKGLGASGAMKAVGAVAIHCTNPTWAEESHDIGGLFSPGKSPLMSWIVFVAMGVLIGGALAVFSAGRFKVETIHGPRFSRNARWTMAIAGGVISGIAAQIGRGCTSGQALTGGAQLALGSWVYMFSVFAGAYGLAYFVRKQWI